MATKKKKSTNKKQRDIFGSPRRPCDAVRQRVSFAGSETRTQQQFKDECDINRIMAQFIKTGLFTHVNNGQPQFGYATSKSFHESLELVRQAQEDFDALPSIIRKRVGHSPQGLLEFLEDPSNEKEARELGLLPPAPAEELRPEVEATPPPPTPSEPEKNASEGK